MHTTGAGSSLMGQGRADCELPHELMRLRYVPQVPGLVNVDFADVRTIMTGAGSSLMGQGRASCELPCNSRVHCVPQVPGLVNVDFADVRTIMTGAGSSLMGQGRASGKGRAKEAALAAISSPLLDIGIERATGIVWNITGPPDMTLFEARPLAVGSWQLDPIGFC